MTFLGALLRRKVPNAERRGSSARLGFVPMLLYCIGCVIGAGIFGTPGNIMREYSGPAVVFSYIIAGVVCGITSYSYADFARRFPSAGGPYAYVYASLGEYCAWIAAIGNTFEYGLCGAAIARLWSKSLQALVPEMSLWTVDEDSVFAPDLYAPLICFLMMCVCLTGIQTSTKLSASLTVLNVSIIVFILSYGSATRVQIKNYEGIMSVPLIDILRGASPAVFSYIGWESACYLSDEVRNAEKTIPRVLYGALAVITVVYSSMVFVLAGMVTRDFDGRETAFMSAFDGDSFARTVIGVVIILCCTNGAYACTQSQTRVWLSVARDGLLPQRFQAVDSETGKPTFSIIATGLLMMVVSALFDFSVVGQATTASCLLVQALVCLGCLVMRGEDRTQMSAGGNTQQKKVDISSRIALLAGILSVIGAGLFVITGDKFDSDNKHHAEIGPSAFQARQDLYTKIMIPVLIAALITATAAGLVSPAKNLDTAIPLLGLLLNFFLVGVAGFAQLGVLVAIMGTLSFIYFGYGIRHSNLNLSQVNHVINTN